MKYRFGSFEIDVLTRELPADGRPVEVEPKVFDLLAYPPRHRDRAVPKDENLDKIWPNQIVTEAALSEATVSASWPGSRRSPILPKATRPYLPCAFQADRTVLGYAAIGMAEAFIAAGDADSAEPYVDEIRPFLETDHDFSRLDARLKQPLGKTAAAREIMLGLRSRAGEGWKDEDDALLDEIRR